MTDATSNATCEERRPSRRKCNSSEKDRIAYRTRVRRRAGMLCQWSNSVFEKRTRPRVIALVCFTLYYGYKVLNACSRRSSVLCNYILQWSQLIYRVAQPTPCHFDTLIFPYILPMPCTFTHRLTPDNIIDKSENGRGSFIYNMYQFMSFTWHRYTWE